MALRGTPIANSQHTQHMMYIYLRFVDKRHNINMKYEIVVVDNNYSFTYLVILFSLFTFFSPKHVLKSRTYIVQ